MDESGERVLVVQGRGSRQDSLTETLTSIGLQPVWCETPEDAARQAGAQRIDVAVIEGDDLEWLAAFRARSPGTRVIVHSRHATLESAKRALRSGAFGFVDAGDGDAELSREINRALQQAQTTAPADVPTADELRTSALSDATVSTLGRILENSLNEVLVFDSETFRCLYCNRGARQNLSYSADELRCLTVLDLKPEFTRESFQRLIRPLRSGDVESIVFETVHRRSDLSEYPVEVHLQLADWSDRTAFVANILDVTQRNESEQKLRASEQRLKSVLDGVPAYIFTVDRAGRILFINRTLKGLSVAEVLGRPVDEFLPEEAARTVRSAIDAVFDTGEIQHYEIAGPGDYGSDAWYSCRLAPVFQNDEVIAAICIATDITERKRIADSIRSLVEIPGAQSGEGFFESMALELARVLGADYTLIGELQDEEPERIRTIAATADGKPVDGFQYALSDTPCEHVIHKSVCSYESGVSDLFPKDALLGEMRAEAYVGVPLFSSSGAVLGIMVAMYRAPLANREFAEGILQVFSTRVGSEMERHRAEQALHENEQRFRAFIEQLPFIVWMAAPGQPVLTYVNPAFEVVSGLPRDSLATIGHEWHRYIHDEDRETLLRQLRAVVRNRSTPAVEFRIVRPDGVVRWLRQYAFIHRDSAGTATNYVGIAEDITDRRLMAEQLAERQSELAHVSRLSTMGEMVTSIAHELAQPLSAILNYSSACQILLQTSESENEVKVSAHIDQMRRQSQRAGLILRRLRDYVRKSAPRKSTCEISTLVADAMELVANELRRRGIRAQIDVPGGIHVRVDRVQIEQVLINLVRNAADAMSDTPEINRVLSISAYLAEGSVIITVQDNGCGLPAGSVDIFKAFFTTKEDGTGMGLAICRTILEEHGGTISTANNETGGATFCITLPQG